mgnify:FL=1
MTGKKVWKMGETVSAQGTVSKPQSMKLQEFSWDTDDDDVRITARMQEEAVVISADFSVQSTKEIFLEVLKAEMEHLATQVASCGGIVGHIKASVKCCETTVISVTLDKADVRNGRMDEINGKFAAILLFMEETKARELTEIMFAAVKEKIKDAGSRMDSKSK